MVKEDGDLEAVAAAAAGVGYSAGEEGLGLDGVGVCGVVV
jgi:hypothetical protein